MSRQTSTNQLTLDAVLLSALAQLLYASATNKKAFETRAEMFYLNTTNYIGLTSNVSKTVPM